MYEVELVDILESDAMTVLLETSDWPSVLDNAIALMERDLANREDLKRLARPVLYFVCRAFGPAHYSMPCGERARHFFLEKRLYDLSFSDAEAFADLTAKQRIKKSNLSDMLLRQADLHKQISRGQILKSGKWKHTFIQVTDFVRRLLGQLNLAENERAQLTEALLSGLADSRNKSIVQIPQCRTLAANMRERLVIREMKNGDVFMAARKFQLSPQTVYRIIKKDTERRKEGGKQVLNPA